MKVKIDQERIDALRALQEVVQKMQKDGLKGDHKDKVAYVLTPLSLLKTIVPECFSIDIVGDNTMALSKREELPIPARAMQELDSAEAMRVWKVKGDILVSIDPTIWADITEWSVILAMVGRHIVNALLASSGGNGDKEAMLNELVSTFYADFKMGNFKETRLVK